MTDELIFDRKRSRRAVVSGAAVVAGAALMPRLAMAAATDDLSDILAVPRDASALHAAITARLGPSARQRVNDIKRWAEIFPDDAAKVRRAAGPATQGMLTLPGTGGKPMSVGNPPSWSKNPTDADEWIASLNRMQHWQTLLTAWALTGNRAYPDKVVAEIDNWMATQPPPPLDDLRTFTRFVPWRALEVGIRMIGSWPMVLQMLAGTEWMPPDRLARFVRTCHDHGQILAIVSPKLWPEASNNHYLTEVVGLLTLAALLPELKQAAAWRDQAWREVVRCAKIQITPEGGQIEGCPHYHSFCMTSFFKAVALARAIGITPDAAFIAQMKAAAMYSLYSTRPDGNGVPWGDSDTSNHGVETIVAASATLDYWEPLGGVRLFATSKSIESAASRSFFDAPQPTDWIQKVIATSAVQPEKVLWARALDQAMFRNNWTADASSVFFACHSPVYGAHAHIDPAGFDFCSRGRPILVDPGRYTYTEGEGRKAFKSAKSHNTVTINEREPFEYLTAWKYGPQKEGRIVKRYTGNGYEAFEALNRAYDPSVHRRLLMLRDTGELIVIDAFEGLQASDTVQLWYHFDSTSVDWRPEVASAVTNDAGKPNISLTVSDGLTGSVVNRHISAYIDHRRDSRGLRLESANGGTTRTFITHVRPLDGAPTIMKSTLAAGQTAGAVRFTIGSDRPMIWIPERSLAQQ